jgi:hypothetical protein
MCIVYPAVHFVYLSFQQCCGSVTCWYEMRLTNDPDPDPAVFVSDIQDDNKNYFFLRLFHYYLLKVHFLKIKNS